MKSLFSNETEIIREVLFVLQGIDGSLLKYNINESRDDLGDSWLEFNLKENENHDGLDESMKGMVYNISQVGLLYKLIMMSVEDARGTVAKTLAAAIKLEMNKYLELVSQLEKQFISGDENKLTLIRMKLWMQVPFRKLKMVYLLLESVKKLHGAYILSAIYRFYVNYPTSNENKQWILQLLKQTSQPCFKFILEWITLGEITDIYQEFFIENGKMNYFKLPSFISRDIGDMIFNTGRAVNLQVKFGRRELNDHEHEINIKILLDGRTGIAEFENWIAKMMLKENSALVQAVIQNHQLLTVINCLRQFVLLGNGEFRQNLMEEVFEYLSKPMNKIYKHDLRNSLDTCLRNIEIKDATMRNIIQQSLDVEIGLIQDTPNQAGWDAFYIHFRVGEPLNSIIQSHQLQKYKKAFQFAWKLKRVEYALCDVWRLHSMTHKMKLKKETVSVLLNLLTSSAILRAKMHNLVSSFLAYSMLDVIESSWKKLKEHIRSCNAFDGLVELHESYISSITAGLLLNESDMIFHTAFESLLSSILVFCAEQQRMFTNIFQFITEFGLITDDADETGWGIKYGDVEYDSEDKLLHLRTLAFEGIQQFNDVDEAFSIKLSSFRESLSQNQGRKQLLQRIEDDSGGSLSSSLQ